MKLKYLVGSGSKIGLATSPFIIVGVVLNILYPSFFAVGRTIVLDVVSAIILAIGVIVWIWSVVLILSKVPQRKLITTGPYAIVKHPLYTGVSLLVLPWLGFLINTWLGVVLGIVLYIFSRIFSQYEEKYLSRTFGNSWHKYCKDVKLKWI